MNQNLAFLEKHKSEVKVQNVVDAKSNAQCIRASIRKKDDKIVWATGTGPTDNDAIAAAMADAEAKGGPPERAETNEKINSLSAENAALVKQLFELTAKAQAAAKTADAVEKSAKK